MRLRRLLSAACVLLIAAGFPQEQTYRGTRYITGGVGAAETQAMRSAAGKYSLAMTFAAYSGELVSGVYVVVKDANSDVVLKAISDGPMLFAALPPGHYTIAAKYRDHTVTREAAVSADRHPQLTLEWHLPEAERLPAPAG